MDIATILGIVIAMAALLGGNALEGGHLSSLVQPTAFLIVAGGTLGAVITGFPMETFVRALKACKGVFFHKHHDPAKLVDEIAEYAVKARREGIIALESVAPNASDDFLRKALMMAVDGIDSKTMRDNLEMMLNRVSEDGDAPAKVLEAGGGYAPTVGIIGAVMGLIHVMGNLSDIAAVGAGIAVAFVATIYGVAFANLFFLPMANKMKIRHHEEMILYEVMLEGSLAIQEGQNPSLIRQKLEGIYAGNKPAAGGATKPAAA